MIHLAGVVGRPDMAQQECSRDRPSVVVIALSDHLACVGRRCDATEPPTDPAALVDHDRLVARVMRACGSVVPFRYGTVVPDEESVRRELGSRHAEFRDVLARLRGRVELAVRATPAPRAGTPTRPVDTDQRAVTSSAHGTGRSYLRSLRPDPSSSGLHQLHSILAVTVEAADLQPDRAGGIKASYLVGSADVDRFCALVDHTVAQLEGVGSVSVTGPWAPYTFAGRFAAAFDAGRALVAAGGPGGRDA